MSTSSYIGVVIKPQDRGSIIKPNLDLLGKGIASEFKNPLLHNTVIDEESEVIRIYHHWDSYPKGLGVTLMEDFNSYEKALNLMGFGDASSIVSEVPTFYNSWRSGEEWAYTKPHQFKSEQLFESKSTESYIYLFKDGNWWVKQCYAIDKEWKLLSEVLKK
jgi:hypothetical protein